MDFLASIATLLRSLFYPEKRKVEAEKVPTDKCSNTPTTSSAYSRGLELMESGDPDDLVGLIAYARYKQMIRDQVVQGIISCNQSKSPSEHQVRYYRNSAMQELGVFASNSIEAAREEIQQSRVSIQLETVQATLVSTINQSTGVVRAIITNLVAWLLTIAITVLIYASSKVPAVASLFGS